MRYSFIALLLCLCCWRTHGQNTCPTLVPDAHQLLSATDAYVGDAAITVTCEPGYRLGSGGLQTSLACVDVISVPTWNGVLGYCVRKACPPLSLGSFMTASANAGNYSDTANVTCDAGYAFAVDLTAVAVGDRVTPNITLTCNDDPSSTSGVWNGAIGTCSVIDCGMPPNVSHSFSVYTTTTYGSHVLYQCHSGYGFTTAQFTSRATCNGTAHWHSDLGPDWAFDDNIRCGGLQRWLGCMENGSLVVGEILVTEPMGIAMCNSHCKTSNYRFSAINNDTCYCSNALVDDYNSTDAEDCNTTCPDYDISSNKTEPFCGGPGGRLSVFVSLDGCFVNANLSGYPMEVVDEERSVTCRERCRGQDSSHAGISVNICYCISNMTGDPGNEIGTAYCGSNNTNHVRIHDLAMKTRKGSTCEALYGHGIRMNGLYYLTGQVNKTQCYFKDGTQCESGWVGYGGNCYYFHIGGVMNFTDAREFCHAKEAELVSITSKQEYQFLHETRTVFSDLEEATSQSACWYLGLVDNHDSNLFSWLDGNLVTYSGFKSNEPDQDGHDCAVDCPLDEHANWQDAECSVNWNVMCKRGVCK